MNNVTQEYEQVYIPKKALVIYQTLTHEPDTFVEAYDMDKSGSLINAHPLSVKESIALSESLASSRELRSSYLQCRDLIPDKVLFTLAGLAGYAVWHTPPQKVHLYFKEELSITSGEAAVPALLWKADKEHLSIYAMKGNNRPHRDTPLYHAPFFNIYETGNVCMGTVEVDAGNSTCLEDFISHWESNFFNSYFSHSISGHKAVKGNIVQLWQQLSGGTSKFPEKVLMPFGKSLKDLLQ